MDMKGYLKQQKKVIDQALSDYLPQIIEKPVVLHEAMRYSVLSNGKRIRPMLLLETFKALNGSENPLPAACSLEFIHCFSLIHDDLPIIDNDDYRRGIPTCHNKYGDAIALLAGDALLAHGFYTLANVQSKYSKAGTVVKLVKELALASSAYGITGGQVVDILAEQDESLHNTGTLEFIHHQKTGSLLAASVRMGAILAGASDEKLQYLTKASYNIGLAFQIKDDILDITGDESLLGKTIGRDEELGKLTFPSIYGLEYATEKCKSLQSEALGLIDFLGSSGNCLRALFSFIVDRQY